MGALARLETWLTEHGVPGPVFEAPMLNATGPTAVVHRAADGQRSPLSLFDEHVLLSFEAATVEKKLLDSLAVGGEWPPSWWSPSWAPFATDGAGQFLVIDGETNQVLAFVHDDEPRPVLASSFEAYVSAIVDGLESGRLVLDPNLGVQSRARLEHWAAAEVQRATAEREVARTAMRAKFVLGLILLIVLSGVVLTWLPRLIAQ